MWSGQQGNSAAQNLTTERKISYDQELPWEQAQIDTFKKQAEGKDGLTSCYCESQSSCYGSTSRSYPKFYQS